MAKRLLEKQKKEIISYFIEGKSIDLLSNDFDCSKLTIIRNLKKGLGELKYKEVINKFKISKIPNVKQIKNTNKKEDNQKQSANKTKIKSDFVAEESPQEETFFSDGFIEIMPLEHDFDNQPQKDISSVPLSQINFPSTVFLIVKKEIELETKYLKDYPEWQFLPKDDLERKTIEIHFDLKTAKRLCSKDQKVIKVPNTDVFRVVTPILLSRGITRIVTDDNLICL